VNAERRTTTGGRRPADDDPRTTNLNAERRTTNDERRVTMPRILLLATTTGYQTRAFGEAAARLGVELVFATDRCHLIEDPWQDHAIPIRFHDEDGSVDAILEATAAHPVDGLLVVGDRPTVIGARVAERLGLPWHPPDAALAARHKLLTRERLRDAGLPVPWFVAVPLDSSSPQFPAPSPLSYPCVLKPVALSGSRGVMRVDDPGSLAAAFERLQALMRQPEVRAERNDAHAMALLEGFIPGREYALEGLMHRGVLYVLGIFDKPDPLDGPFFEETIYLTPSSAPARTQRAIVDGVSAAVRALGLHHGPIHAECRVNAEGVYVLEVAARPIGGLCARALRLDGVGSRLPFFRGVEGDAVDTETASDSRPLEEVLLRHALGDDPAPYRRERAASGVMMIPIPRRGVLRGVAGIDAAREVPGVEEIHITAKPDQLLVPLPEGASYLGFVFARATHADGVEQALRDAHARLVFTIEPELPLLRQG
jgi:hypothetical protein